MPFAMLEIRFAGNFVKMQTARKIVSLPGQRNFPQKKDIPIDAPIQKPRRRFNSHRLIRYDGRNRLRDSSWRLDKRSILGQPFELGSKTSTRVVRPRQRGQDWSLGAFCKRQKPVQHAYVGAELPAEKVLAYNSDYKPAVLSSSREYFQNPTANRVDFLEIRMRCAHGSWIFLVKSDKEERKKAGRWQVEMEKDCGTHEKARVPAVLWHVPRMGIAVGLDVAIVRGVTSTELSFPLSRFSVTIARPLVGSPQFLQVGSTGGKASGRFPREFLR
ncbi:hypothetical protein KM043_012721 [Ampulex compressa]|nr:hypothetical protein KM043_012721 [Ampulex compressa]